MLEETHRKITEKIGKELNRSDREISLLKTGSTLPDSWGDFPHHRGKELEIMQRIINSRKMLLKNDDKGFTELGVSLHYIQDLWTLRPRTADKHTEWERMINKAFPSLVFPLVTLEKLLLSALNSDSNKVKDLRSDRKYIEPLINLFSGLPNKALNAYIGFVQSLIKIEEKGFPSWFDGIFVVKHGEDAEVHHGISASILRLSVLGHPPEDPLMWNTWSTTVLDLNFAYKISFEITRQILDTQCPLEWDEKNKSFNICQRLQILPTFPTFDPLTAPPIQLIALSKGEIDEIKSIGRENRKCINCIRIKQEVKKGWFGPKSILTCSLTKAEVRRDHLCDNWEMNWGLILSLVITIKEHGFDKQKLLTYEGGIHPIANSLH